MKIEGQLTNMKYLYFTNILKNIRPYFICNKRIHFLIFSFSFQTVLTKQAKKVYFINYKYKEKTLTS